MNANFIPMSGGEVTMTSREIAGLVEARHNDIVATIERLFSKGLLRSSRKSRRELTGGRPADVFDLIERDTHLVVAGYSDEHRARVIDRWQELEARVTLAVPQTMAQALRLAADQAERLEAQQLQIEAAKPAVEFVERYVHAEGLTGFREVCKLLKANEAHFREFVFSSRIMYRLGRALTAYQAHIDAGRFEVRAGVAKASDRAFSTTKFTAKGVDWIAGEWGKYQVSHGDVQ